MLKIERINIDFNGQKIFDERLAKCIESKFDKEKISPLVHVYARL